MTPVIELATSEVKRLESQRIELEEQLGTVVRVLEAWRTIIHADTESNGLVAPMLVENFNMARETAEEKIESSKAYGDKSDSLRRFILSFGLEGVTRFQVVQYSKTIGGHANFPYRFLTRMIDSGELLMNREERYIGTDKMREKIREEAA
jgi:hypothetical protein